MNTQEEPVPHSAMDQLVALLQRLEKEARQEEREQAKRTAVPNFNASF